MSERLIDRMRRASANARRDGVPRCYVWCALWWRLQARLDSNPAECLSFAENQLRLYRDMLARPEHYRRKPGNRVTDWQWMGAANV